MPTRGRAESVRIIGMQNQVSYPKSALNLTHYPENAAIVGATPWMRRRQPRGTEVGHDQRCGAGQLPGGMVEDS
jgi:hypothetical protein